MKTGKLVCKCGCKGKIPFNPLFKEANWYPEYLEGHRPRVKRGKYHISVNGAARKKEACSGSKSHLWQGGIKYESTISDETKELVKARDNHTCQGCGSKKRLAVHHINFDISDNATQNLITLCGKCHGKTQIDRFRAKVDYAIKLDLIREREYAR